MTAGPPDPRGAVTRLAPVARRARRAAHGVRRVVAERADIGGLAPHEQAVDSLEVAVAENARLAVGLERQVAQIEAELAVLIERQHRGPRTANERSSS